ncbi:hypothetical protein ACFCXS_25665 [Streptomyces sp. NPDC056373]|uniref:hypothetical protein n=1 Tax=Streptomyces sp. NPDC056373 TaxID=3345798 RepID=UPI0035DCC4AB
MSHRLVNLEVAIDKTSMRTRKAIARILGGSEYPVLQALSRELLAANAIEDARLAEIGTELIRDRIAEADAASADLPEPPAYGA